jgi:phosphopantothenoylcysteine decarboxylase/phosphopantothenate--cysteine ligase
MSTSYNKTSANKMVKASNGRILLGVSGGIAAYKCADLVRRLKERDFEVRVVMTQSAAEFITPMTLQAVSGNPVHQDLFDLEMEAAMGHIELARWADYLLIAPATANTIAKLVHGEGDNLLTTVVLATDAPLFIAPAMNQQMWANLTTQQNIQTLKSRGCRVFGPASGEQACGDVGAGRMLEPVEIADKMLSIAKVEQCLQNHHVIITAGPTQEAIDPVRYISNHSSGKMGYAIAEAAYQAGAKVTLISGPVNLSATKGIELKYVTSAAEMLNAVKETIEQDAIFIGCAAVADYRPVDIALQKIKKNNDKMQLELERNPDILAWVAEQKLTKLVVGFAAESEHLKEYAQKKLNEKQLDLICANDISNKQIGFNSDQNQLLLLDRHGNEKLLSIASKVQLAQQIVVELANKIKS